MRAIVNTSPNQLQLQTLPLPEPGPGQVRIRTGACGICATDILMVAGWNRTGFPAIPGHEWSGVVDEVGAGVDSALAGCRCVAENVLLDGGEVGFEHPGGYGEYFLTEAERVRLLPADFPFEKAVLIEPLAVCVRALRRLRIEPAAETLLQRALILGDGPIGLILVMLLQRLGFEDLCLLGGRESRLAVARQLGATRTLNYHHLGAELTSGLLKAAGGEFPLVIEASGAAAAMQASLYLTAVGGRIGVLGDYSLARADFPWNHLLHRELELVGSNASAGAWDEAVRLAVEEKLPLDRLVSHCLPVEQFMEGIELTRQHRGDVIKVVLEWN